MYASSIRELRSALITLEDIHSSRDDNGKQVRSVRVVPEMGPNCAIFPSHGRGSGPGSKRDIMRFDFFLLSAWE